MRSFNSTLSTKHNALLAPSYYLRARNVLSPFAHHSQSKFTHELFSNQTLYVLRKLVLTVLILYSTVIPVAITLKSDKHEESLKAELSTSQLTCRHIRHR